MLKGVLLVGGTVLVSGCASMNLPDEQLPDNVKLSEPGSFGKQYIEEMVFTKPGVRAELVPKCVVMLVSNDAFETSDVSKSFVGRATGNYHQIVSQEKQEGGTVLQYAADDEAVANGRLEFEYSYMGIPSQDVLSFRVMVKAENDVVNYSYKSLKRASKHTGAMENAGFSPLGGWSSAKPFPAYQAVERLTNGLHQCITGKRR